MDITSLFVIFILAGFIGYYIIWGITPSLHAPLMSVSNAISGIIIIGAISVVTSSDSVITLLLGLTAIVISSINVFGGFAISQRMLQMFRKKRPISAKDQHHE